MLKDIGRKVRPGWQLGQIGKKAAAAAATRSASAPPAASEPAEPAPSASHKRKRSGNAKRVAKSRAAAQMPPDRRRLAAEAAKLPKDLGATASGRYDTWARHMHYILNLPGDPPDCHVIGWAITKATKNKNKNK